MQTIVAPPKTRPILFKGEMVNAILLNFKTQTRRIVHPKLLDKPCPWGTRGDLLWVRETFCEIEGELVYRAAVGRNFINPGYWTPSIFMPRDASRLTLRINSTWCESLHNISEADAIAEGCLGREDFRALWRSINGRSSWEVNPMVWAIEFEVIK